MGGRSGEFESEGQHGGLAALPDHQLIHPELTVVLGLNQLHPPIQIERGRLQLHQL